MPRIIITICGVNSDGPAQTIVACNRGQAIGDFGCHVDKAHADLALEQSHALVPGDLGGERAGQLMTEEADFQLPRRHLGAQHAHAAGGDVQHDSDVARQRILGQAAGAAAADSGCHQLEDARSRVEMHGYFIEKKHPADEWPIR